MIQAPKRWKSNVREFALPLREAFDDGDSIALPHFFPFLENLNAGNTLHNNVFSANRVSGIGAPGQNLRDGDRGFCPN